MDRHCTHVMVLVRASAPRPVGNLTARVLSIRTVDLLALVTLQGVGVGSPTPRRLSSTVKRRRMVLCME